MVNSGFATACNKVSRVCITHFIGQKGVNEDKTDTKITDLNERQHNDMERLCDMERTFFFFLSSPLYQSVSNNSKIDDDIFCKEEEKRMNEMAQTQAHVLHNTHPPARKWKMVLIFVILCDSIES